MTVSITPGTPHRTPCNQHGQDAYASDLDSVCIQGVTFYRNAGDSDAQAKVQHLRELLQEVQAYKEKYKWLCSLMKEEQETAQQMYESSKEQGLNFNTIETEGCLRGANLMYNLVQYVEENS